MCSYEKHALYCGDQPVGPHRDTPASGAIITVPTDQPTIQAAVTAAVAGDTIKIESGVYFENVTVPAGKDGLQILGTNADTTIVDARPLAPTGTGPGFTISSNNVTIAKLTVRHAEFDPSFTIPGDGVRCVAAGCTLQDLHLISNGGNGADIDGNNAVVMDSFISGNASEGLLLVNGDNAQILKNVAQNQEKGGFILTGSNMRIEGNTANVIEDNEGFRVTGNNNMILKNSSSITDGEGFEVDGNSNIISGNEVLTAEEDGINVIGALNTVTGNSVQGAANECYELTGNDPVIENNSAESCGEDGFRISGNNPVVEKNKAAFILGGGGFDIEGSNPQVIGNRAEFMEDDGFQITCNTDCTGLLVQRNTAMGAADDDEGFDIFVAGGTGAGWIVEQNTAMDNVSDGFEITGSGGIIRRNKALRNGNETEHGFDLDGDNNEISFNQAFSNQGDGFEINGSNNTISKNKADKNLLDGIHLTFGDLNTVSANSAAKNQADGIRNDSTNTTLTNNKAGGNQTDCTSNFLVGATVAVDTGNKCADGSSFSLTQTDRIH
ncbi:MAG: right-handed parallel beta-helix repeat-containing protein [Candidatus Binatia bacterium]